MTRLVFIDVDDTLLTPPYEAVRRVSRMLGKDFPDEQAFLNRNKIHFYDAFPDIFRSPLEMWAIALLALPFGYFRSQKALQQDLHALRHVLSDNRVYLISKNPPSFTRWRVKRLYQIFGVQLGDRYIACGPMFKKGKSKNDIIIEIAADRGVEISDCLLIDDSAENLLDANGKKIGGLLVRSTWNSHLRAELAALPHPIQSITVDEVGQAAKDALSAAPGVVDKPKYFLVPPLGLKTGLQIMTGFAKRWWLYSEAFPLPNQVIPVARNPWTSLLVADPHAKTRARLAELLKDKKNLSKLRIVSTESGGHASILPLDVKVQADTDTTATSSSAVDLLREYCKKQMIGKGHRIVRDADFFFEQFDRNVEVERIVNSERITQAAQLYASQHNVTTQAALHKARQYAIEISANRRYLGCATSFFLMNLANLKIFRKMTVESHDKIRGLERDHFIVYAATHRSVLDSGILYTVLAQQARTYPFIVGADKVKKMWVGKLGSIAGGFFIQRRFVDGIYASVLAEHVSHMQKHGNSLEVFLEGQRSRSGLTLPPKRGIAGIVWRNLIPEDSAKTKVAIVPVSFTYNKLPESELIIRESYQERKTAGLVSLREEADIKIKMGRKSSILKKARALIRRARSSRVSECNITFGDPLILNRPAFSSKAEDDQNLQKNLNEVMRRINGISKSLPTSILSLGLLCSHDNHMTRDNANAFLRLSEEILALYASNGHYVKDVAKTDDSQVEEFLELPFVNRKFKKAQVNERDILCISDLDSQRAAYYKNNVMHFYILPSLLSLALVESNTGLVRELHRFFDHLFDSLQDKYFLPLSRNSEVLINDLLALYERWEFITVTNGHYVVTSSSVEDSFLHMLARLGSEVLEDDLADILAKFKRVVRRVDVAVPATIKRVTSTVPLTAEMTASSQTGFFLVCDPSPKVGDRVTFKAADISGTGRLGIVSHQEYDGVVVKYLASDGARMAVGTEDLSEKSKIPGTFTFERQITVTAELTNLSPNGAFIATQESFSHGDVVDCQVNAVDSPLAVQGRVTRRTEGGIGIAFQNVTVEDNARLLALLANLTKEQGALV